MEQEEKAPTLFNHALKWGIISGAISIVIFVALYVINYALMVNWKFAIVGLLIGLTIVSYAGVDYRKQIGGLMPYGQAWQHGFLTFAVSGLISILFSLLLYNVIDTELPQKLTDVSMETTREMMEGFGMPADQIDSEVEKAKARTENQFKPGGMAIGYLIQLVIFAILALVTALFARKNPPQDQM